MIDLDAIKGRANSAYLLDRDDGDALFAAMGDVKALIAEVERLRHDVADLQMQREQNIIDNMHAYEEGVAEGERRAVAYLREQANAEHPIERGVPSLSLAGCGLLLLHADIIERGEHRREEK